MATINLGAIKFNWKGAYAGGTAYAVDDVVSSGGSSYVCILASTGNATSNGTYWEQMSSAGTNGTDGTDVGTTLTTQGDLLYRDGSGLQRLAKGTAGKALVMNSGATAPEWGAGGSVPIVETFNNTLSFFSTSSLGSYVDVTALDTTITPSSSSSKILIMVALDCAVDVYHYQSQFRIQRKIGGGSFGATVTNGYGSGDQQSSSRSSRSEDDANGGNTMMGTYVDIPNTTSAVTYRIQVMNASGGTLYLNRNSANSAGTYWQRAYACKVIAMELKQ